MPRMISGTIIGIMDRFSSAPRALKWRPDSPTAPSVPSAAADALLISASSKLLKNALMSVWLRKSFPYQENVKPAQWNSFVSLNE